MNPILLLGGIAAILLLTKNKGGSAPAGGGTSLAQQKQALIAYINSGGDTAETKAQFANVVNNQMTAAEVGTVYTFIFSYIKQGAYPEPGSAFAAQFQAVNNKYNLFS